MTEDDFYQRWCELAADQKPADMVQLAGALATSPGQIFVAGYQAAIRDTFPELQHKGWFCFAVTEDRRPILSKDSALPGVTLEDGKVTGFKTWIAAADNVDVLVLKVGNGDDAVYGWVSAEDAGVVISLRASSFLADMSQGTAEFRAAAFTPLADSSRVREFHRSEPFYIYMAFLARMSEFGADIPTGDSGKSGAKMGECAAAALKAQSERPDLVKLDLAVSELLTIMDREGITLGDHWDTDRRLFTLYSKGIQGT